MNELHTEAARLDEQIADLRRELDDFNGTNSDSSRRSLLKNLEVRLAQTEERSRLYEEKFEEGSRSLRESQVIIEKIHKHIGAAAEMSPQQDMDIGNHGVTESNMMIYLGLIEQRLATMLRQQKIHFTSSEYDTPRHSGLGGVSTMTVPPAAGARGQSSASPTFGVSSHAPVTVDPPQVNGCSFFLNNIQFSSHRLSCQIRDDSGSDASNDDDEEERPLTLDEIKAKALRGLERRSQKHPAASKKFVF